MKKAPDEVKSWQQLSLLGGGATEVTMRIGCMPDADHAQVQVEVRTAATHELLGMWARPHVAWDDVLDELPYWFGVVAEQVERCGDPFP
jgi:hypothetical protein